MRKLLCIVLGLFILASLCSCDLLDFGKGNLSSLFDKPDKQEQDRGDVAFTPSNSADGQTDGPNGSQGVGIIGGNGFIGIVKPDDSFEPSEEECFHEWLEANCTDPIRCRLCGKTEGEPWGHTFEGAAQNCTEQLYCQHCGLASPNEPLGHDWQEADCLNDAYCLRCGEIGEKALGHTGGGEVTCEAYLLCERCGRYYGEYIQHEFTELTCDQDSVCRLCGVLRRPAVGHNYLDGVCSSCNGVDPDYRPQTPSQNVIVSALSPSYPHSIPGGSIEGVGFEVSGKDIIVTVTVKKTHSDGELKLGWRLLGSGYAELKNGSESTPFMSAGSTDEYTFIIHDAIVSAHDTYKVHVGYDQYA